MNNGESSSSGILIGILIVVVIVIVGWIAYSQGFFMAGGEKTPADSGSVQINVGGSSNTPAGGTGY